MAYINQIAAIPGLSPEQVTSLYGLMTILSASLNDVFDKHFGPLPSPSTKPPQYFTPKQPSTSPPVQPAVTTTKSGTQQMKKKRNEKTRLQHKRRKALRVTVQPSVKEVEHTNRVRVEKTPRKHAVLKRIKPVPWDGSATSLQSALQQSECCWYAAIQMDGMTMVRHGTGRMPRIGIG